MEFVRNSLAAFGAIALMFGSGCETYRPLPLDAHPRLAADPASLRQPPEGEPAIDFGRPLTVEAVALLAVLNNPDLVAARADRAIAEAQSLQAGLLPNPQISASYGFLRAGPGTTDQWTAGLAEDVRALVTYSAIRRGAALAARQAEADLLWQEWQVIGKARLMVVDRVQQLKSLELLRASRSLLADRYARDRRAVEDGNLTRSSVAADLAALADIDRQLAEAEQKDLVQGRDLDLLLGLEPSVKLPLAPAIDMPPVDPAQVETLMEQLPARRPDLIALKLGYGSQEEKLRAAILGQFPALVLGGSGGHDNTAVYAFGPTVTMDLPIFNRNQGNIAIEKATRAKLHDEYVNRLNADRAQIRGLLADQALLQRQRTTASAAAREADSAGRSADSAYASTLIDARSYADLVAAALSRKQEVVMIDQAILEGQAALATLTGIAMPLTESVPDAGGAAP